MDDRHDTDSSRSLFFHSNIEEMKPHLSGLFFPRLCSSPETTCHCTDCRNSNFKCRLKPGGFCVYLRMAVYGRTVSAIRTCAQPDAPRDMALCLRHGHGGDGIQNPQQRPFSSYCCQRSFCNVDLETAQRWSADYELAPNATTRRNLVPRPPENTNNDLFGLNLLDPPTPAPWQPRLSLGR